MAITESVVLITPATILLSERLKRGKVEPYDVTVDQLADAVERLGLSPDAPAEIRVIFGSADADDFDDHAAEYTAGEMVERLRGFQGGLPVVVAAGPWESVIGGAVLLADPKHGAARIDFYEEPRPAELMAGTAQP